jgi:RNA polymerase sigma factor (sigma-70 family)
MSREDVQDRLSGITTDWDMLRQTRGSAAEARAAQEVLLLRYRAAVRRYLGRVAGNPDAAEELFQEFGLAVVEGKLGSANPDRGRFRDYVKAVLRNLVAKHYRRQKKHPAGLEPDSPVLAEAPAPVEADDGFDRDWRDALLARAWAALADAHRHGYEVFRFRIDHLDLTFEETAERLTARLGRALSPEAVRQAFSRARKQFALLLVGEVGHSLAAPTPEAVAEELAELGLLDYCRPALPESGS